MKLGKQLVFWMGALPLVLVMAGCGSTTTNAMQTIKVGLQNIPEDYVQQGKDWGAPYGLKETYVVSPNASQSFQELFSGQVDVIDAGSGPLLSALAKDPGQLVIIGVRHRGGQRDEVVVRADSPYQSVKDLLGKPIGIPVGSGVYIAWEGYLQKQGWKDSDFKLVNMQPGTQKQALAQKQVDAVISWEPTPSFIITTGQGKEIANFGDVTTDPNFFVTTKKYAQAHAKELAAFLASDKDVANFVQNDVKAASQMAVDVAKGNGVTVSPAAFERAFSKMNVDPAIHSADISDLKPVADYMVQTGVFSTAPDYASTVDQTYANAAQKLTKSIK